MPVSLGETRHADHSTPQEQRDAEPDRTAAIVGKEPREEAGERVEIVEDRSGHYLVLEARPGVVELAHVQLIASVVLKLEDVQRLTNSLVLPGMGGRKVNAQSRALR